MKYSHIASRALNNPLLLRPSYARHALAFIGQRIGAEALIDVDGVMHANLPELAASFSAAPQRKTYSVTRDGIAIIPISGSLIHKSGNIDPYSGTTGYDGLAVKLAQAEADADVRGVMLDIDSPGGEVAGCFAFCDALAAAQKPVWGHANEQACSAAYAILSQCDKVFASQTAHVGSIGVLVAHTDISAAMQAKGIAITLIHAGAKKVDGNQFEALPDSVRDEIQASCESVRALFADYVARGRGLEAQAVLGTEAAVFMAGDALSIGLIDGVASFESALQTFASQLGTLDMDEQALNAARAEGAADERARISAILNHPEAKGREAAALVMATTIDIPAEQAALILASSPKTATVPASPGMAVVETLAPDAEKAKPSTLAQRVKTLKGI